MNTCRICGKEIGKTYSDKKLRCSSCRKSVENAIGYNERTVEYVDDELYAWKSEYKKLKKENKKLNEKLKDKQKVIQYYRKEKKNLKEENDRLKNNAMEDMRVQTKLEEKIRFLEECLDRKEKLNEEYRKELKNYVYDAKQVRDIC